MTRQELLQRSSTLLGHFAHEVKVANTIGLFDINTIAEDFLIPILATAFNCPDLCNQNRIRMNFPAVDLGCETSRTSIQITSDSSSSKVCKTLEKFESHSLSNDFDSLYVYVITQRQKSYTFQKLTEAASSLSIDFDPSSNIFDFQDLAKMIGELTNKQIEHINGHLEVEFEKSDANLQFRSDLDAFLGVSQQKIEDETSMSLLFAETDEIFSNIQTAR